MRIKMLGLHIAWTFFVVRSSANKCSALQLFINYKLKISWIMQYVILSLTSALSASPQCFENTWKLKQQLQAWMFRSFVLLSLHFILLLLN
jgi:hypothetical protein